MPLAVGALNERHARHDARQGACAFFVGRITLLHRPGHRAAALRSTLAGLGMAARLIHKREHGATRPSRAGLPDSESTRNLPLRGKPLPLGERREPEALSSLVRRVARLASWSIINSDSDFTGRRFATAASPTHHRLLRSGADDVR